MKTQFEETLGIQFEQELETYLYRVCVQVKDVFLNQARHKHSSMQYCNLNAEYKPKSSRISYYSMIKENWSTFFVLYKADHTTSSCSVWDHNGRGIRRLITDSNFQGQL